MGADGGIAWVGLNSPVEENRKRLTKLLPWVVSHFGGRLCDPSDDWVDHNTEKLKGMYYGPYGTDHEFSLDELPEIMRDVQLLIENGKGSMTFAHVWQEFRTALHDEDRNATMLEHVLAASHGACCYNSAWPKAQELVALLEGENPPPIIDDDQYFFFQTPGQWLEIIKSCVKHQDGVIQVFLEETWT